MEQSNSPEVEFSRPIPVEQIGVQETVRQIVANASERVRLAERFGLIALDRLQAKGIYDQILAKYGLQSSKLAPISVNQGK